MKNQKIMAELASLLSEQLNNPRLINITEGGNKEVIPLGRAILLVGRTEEANINLEDDSVSRNHASIVKVGDHYCLRDNGSTNGSYVNGERVKFRQLEHHDVIRFGYHRFLVDLGEDVSMTEPHTGKRFPKVKIPSTHQNETYNLTYNLQVKNQPTENLQETPSSTHLVTVMAKGHVEEAFKNRSHVQRNAIAICPECKTVVKSETGQCPLCGTNLR